MTVLAQNGKIWVPKRDTPPVVQKVSNTPARIAFGVLSLLLYAFAVLEILGVIPGIAITSSSKIEAHKVTVVSTEPGIPILAISLASIIVATIFLAIACNIMAAQEVAILVMMAVLLFGFFYANTNQLPAINESKAALNELYYQETGQHEDVLEKISFNSDNKATMTTKDDSVYLISADYKNSTTVYSIKELEAKN